ncbi:MAG: hypothetical protein KDC54_20780, partial [Lewinella sp.]|nr:hypothetical protein [Lewinella sp.]
TPSAPQWCLKYLHLSVPADGYTLGGNWTAEGCQPGGLRLRRPGVYEEEVAFAYPGRWTGHLSQSDREYGFYFEMILAADGTGTSHIVSEGAGGEAVHDLRWQENADGLSVTEYQVQERTDPDWKWCLKSLELVLARKDEQHQLTGDWEGYLEDKDPTTGACAPGRLFLSKPVLTRTVIEEITPQTSQYTESTGREVQVDRVLRVRSESLRIKVWDNGIVDGDIVTLFLNGERIVEQYRVSKRKWSIPVDVHAGENLLILHAEDLGDISPNTVAVSIDDGVEEQVIILSSNLAESGAILIQPFIVD